MAVNKKGIGMTGRRAVNDDDNNGFAVRTVQAMACEMVETRARMNTIFVQFEALAISLGVVVNWHDHLGL